MKGKQLQVVYDKNDLKYSMSGQFEPVMLKLKNKQLKKLMNNESLKRSIEYKRVVNETKVFNSKITWTKSFEYDSFIALVVRNINAVNCCPNIKKRTNEDTNVPKFCTLIKLMSTIAPNHLNTATNITHNMEILQTKKTFKDSTTSTEKELIEGTVHVYTTGDTVEAELCEKIRKGHFYLIKCNKHNDEG
ncbi:hypothetical protein RFI_00046 [Reticulomyxa filosa]|uniref:Uncharacterized protein n=1 Tax=Reticulomyxa filosa TaxID=46433 RepID=X6PFL9_RETFI|nr:hypothetical protein RFI_00046 [Reticulomyxa filosa]|eukprot:ETO37016.1 hypothetical protein RFI_00046 [Reticulomyxa filosa]